jgi:Putative collagen-binding domain of a collagenase
MVHVKALFSSRRWEKLVPDAAHTFLTAGLGTPGLDSTVAALAADGSFGLAYVPSLRTVTVDMSRLSGPATARWFDPTQGTYVTVSGSPFPNSGARTFTPPGNNGTGTGDWVLVLE